MRASLVVTVAASLLLGTAVVAGAAPPSAVRRAASIVEAWTRLPDTGSACGDDLIFDYGKDGGMRNFFCRALTVYSWKTFLASAPRAPFRKGPHKNGKLNLKAERDFGRYDPAFVTWATTALIPAAGDEALRAATQPVYDQQVRELAHVYFLVDQALSADAKWVERERQRYLVSMDKKGGGWDVWEITDAYHSVLGTPEQDWGGHDPNHVRSAVMWWLRRHHDETAALWRVGLVRLLTTYDAQWLREQTTEKATKKKPTTTLPAPPSEPETPEYH